VIVLLMGGAYLLSNNATFDALMLAPTVFAFGLVAFGFLGMGPVTIAVDSYGPVTDNAQSVYELSLIETLPGIENELKRDFGINADFEHAKLLLEENDGAGNTFKATAKPVLIGTAVVGATTMIFSIIVLLAQNLMTRLRPYDDSRCDAPHRSEHLDPQRAIPARADRRSGLIYWFSGASCQAVITGAYRAVAFIKHHMKLEGATKASTEDSKRVVAICTSMRNGACSTSS
jgi:K(+)-stimulated pyrophosphate-energized sodium pump